MKVATIFFLLGILSGAIYGITKFIVFIFKNNLIAQIICDLMFTLSSGAIYLFFTNKYFYGEIRAYICTIFVLGMYFERKTLGKLFAKLEFMLYNWGITMVNRAKSTKIGKIIFK